MTQHTFLHVKHRIEESGVRHSCMITNFTAERQAALVDAIDRQKPVAFTGRHFHDYEPGKHGPKMRTGLWKVEGFEKVKDELHIRARDFILLDR